jgi:hypothetical protein
MKWSARLLVLVAMVGVLAGCSKPPQVEMDAAKAKLDAARAAQADAYAPAEWQAAQDAMNAAEQEITAQNAKMALTRNYKQAKTLAMQADEAAARATQAAAEGKERMRGEADALIMQAAGAIESTNALMAKAPRGKESKAELELIAGDITAATASLEEARSAMAGTDYVTAKAKAQAVLDKMTQVSTELQTAIDKRAGR